jgi:PDZ domain-containing protein
MRNRLALALAVFLGVVLIAAQVIRLPYLSEGPGPTHDVIPMIKVSGHPTYPPAGHLLLTTVSLSSEPLTPLQLFIAWLDPQEDVLPESDFVAPGGTLQEETTLQRYAMDQSQLDATVVALSKVGDYPASHLPGAIVESTVEGCDAAGKLFSGNVITSINGQAIDDSQEASKLIEATPPGKPIRFTAKAGSKTVTVSLKRTDCAPHGDGAYVGVILINNFPFEVSIDDAGIGGPSAGLMFSLGLYDKLTPGDLTGGRTIAGTGQIGPDGTVYPIGGVEKKVYAAETAGADVFLVPKQDFDAAKATGVDIQLVPVATFDEALAALNGDTGGDTKKGE